MPTLSAPRSFCVLALAGAAMPASGLVINPTFINAAGETWTADRQATFNQAITDWENLLVTPEGTPPVSVDVTFANAGTGGFLGQWQGSRSLQTNLTQRPWSSTVSHTISFNADLVEDTGDNFFLWFDGTPEDGSDQTAREFDALSVARHEIGHMLGFTDAFYRDNQGTSAEAIPWNDLIDADGVFDAGGLNVQMLTSDLSHVSNAALNPLMRTVLPNGIRRPVELLDAQQLALAFEFEIVPEPTAVALFSAGGLLLLRRRSAA